MNKNKKLFMSAILVFTIYAASIALIGLSYKPSPADVAIVLGNDVNTDGTPFPQLKARLDAALELYKNKTVKKIIASGGVERYAPFNDEAVFMGKYLRENGVNAQDIIEDSAGSNSMATAINSAKIMKERDFKSAVIVSQYFHLPRCSIAFNKAGITNYSAAYPKFFMLRDIYSTMREAVAILKYLIIY